MYLDLRYDLLSAEFHNDWLSNMCYIFLFLIHFDIMLFYVGVVFEKIKQDRLLYSPAQIIIY